MCIFWQLTGSVTCTFYLAAPVAGARSLGPWPRAPGKIRDISPVLEAGRDNILPGPAPLFRPDQRLYRECVRFDAQRARGPPLLCHFSLLWRDERKEGNGVKSCKEQEKFTTYTNESTISVLWAVGCSIPSLSGPTVAGQRITSPLSVSAVRTLGKCQQPELLERRAGESELSVTAQINQSRANTAPRNFCLVPPVMGAARAALCGKSRAGE